MTSEQFLQQFGHFIDAPNGVQKMRELILKLAVQGKVATQDASDEAAAILLKKISSEKDRLIKEGTIKKIKPQPAITDDETYFPLPSGWTWAHLEDVSQYIQRGKGPKYAESSEIPVISQKCIQWAGFDISRARFLDPSALEKYQEERFLQDGDLLWNSTGTGTIGRINIFPKHDVPYEKIVADSHVTVVRLLNMVPRYVWIWIASPYIQATIEGDASGSTNQVELATAKVKWQPVPIPPLAEQDRIVAKVDELMALCDQLEAERNAREETHQRLIRAVHHPLTEASDTATTQTAWRRIRDNFADLYTTLESVQALRETILQLAVQGRLVAQDSSDEPVAILLDKVNTEKNQLIQDGVIKKKRTAPAINESDAPYRLPVGWKWVPLDHLVSVMDAGWSPACPPEPSPSDSVWGVLKTTAVQRMQYQQHENKVLSEGKGPRPQYEVQRGDILITRAGPKNRVAISCLVEKTRPKLMISDKIIRFHLVEVGMSDRFISLCLNTGSTADYLEKAKSGMAESQMNISQDKLRLAPIPLAPVHEQHRIVTKVDKLMAICDQLETNIKAKSETAAQYAEAAIQKVAAA